MSEIAYFEASFPRDLRGVTELFREHSAAVGAEFCFQGFEEELASLPGLYAPPDGSLWVVTLEDQYAGCVAMRPLGPGICEMKRLYVRPSARGLGIGRALAHRVIEDARSAGYRLMRLDTLESMRTARALYTSMEFVECDPYKPDTVPGVVFMERVL